MTKYELPVECLVLFLNKVFVDGFLCEFVKWLSRLSILGKGLLGIGLLHPQWTSLCGN